MNLELRRLAGEADLEELRRRKRAMSVRNLLVFAPSEHEDMKVLSSTRVQVQCEGVAVYAPAIDRIWYHPSRMVGTKLPHPRTGNRAKMKRRQEHCREKKEMPLGSHLLAKDVSGSGAKL